MMTLIKHAILNLSSFLIISLICIVFNQVQAAESTSEAQLKTIYVYNFSRFVQWPEQKNITETFLLCTYPHNRFGKLLYQLEQRQINNKPIQVKEVNSVQDIKQCHAVFIDSVPDKDLDKALAIAQKNHVLTISEQEKFAHKGGMIQMFINKDKVRFNINYNSSQQAGLQINSKLLELASNVIRLPL